MTLVVLMPTDGNIRKIAAQNEEHSKQSDQSMHNLKSLPLMGNAKWSTSFLRPKQSKTIAMLLSRLDSSSQVHTLPFGMKPQAKGSRYNFSFSPEM